MNKKHIILLSIFISGFTSITSQILFLREFLVIFNGNEVSVGIFLSVWFLCGCLGGFFASKISDRLNYKIFIFSLLFFLLSISLPAAFIFLRVAKSLMQFSAGEIAGYASICTAGGLTLIIPCSIFAFTFGLACRIFREIDADSSEHIGKIYLMEALGALFGGVIVSLFLIKMVHPLQTLFFLASLNLFVSVILLSYCERSHLKRLYSVILILGVAVLSIFIFFNGVSQLRKYSLAKLWGKYDLISSKDSIFGNVAMTKKDGLFSFYENGTHLYSVPDRFSAEEKVHFALLQHPHPKNVLLIGGGVGGVIGEVFKYDVEKVDYVELDPLITATAEEYLPEKYINEIKDPRLNVINTDGRSFIKNTLNKYDCILINVGDPLTIQINRFYTLETFSELKNILKPNGIVSFSLLSSQNYLGNDLKKYISSVYSTAACVFEDILLIPGNYVYFILATEKDELTKDYNALVSRIRERDIHNDYIGEYYLFDRMSEERIEEINSSIQKFRDSGINRDFHPVSYFYAVCFWETQLDKPFFKYISKYLTSRIIWMFAGICVLLPGLIYLRMRKGKIKRIVLASLIITGFSEIVFQVIIMISFQSIYGYLYYKLGLIASFFMTGLAIGSLVITKISLKPNHSKKMFLYGQLGIFAQFLFLIPIFLIFPGSKNPILEWVGRNIVFLILPFISGFFGGVQFVLSNKICLSYDDRTGKVSSQTYTLDLLGASVGAFLSSIILIPIIGIFGTCLLLAVINAVLIIFYSISLKWEV